MPISLEAKASNRLIIEGICTLCVCVCARLCLCTDTFVFHRLVDGPAGRVFQRGGKRVSAWLFLIFPFISPSKKVPPVIPAICHISCHTCLVCFQGKEKQKRRGEEAVRREGDRKAAAVWWQFCG